MQCALSSVLERKRVKTKPRIVKEEKKRVILPSVIIYSPDHFTGEIKKGYVEKGYRVHPSIITIMPDRSFSRQEINNIAEAYCAQKKKRYAEEIDMVEFLMKRLWSGK